MPTKLLNFRDKQYCITGFFSHDLLKKGDVPTYSQKFLNTEQRFLYEFPAMLGEINLGYTTLINKAPYLIQTTKAKRISTMQELESQGYINKIDAKLIKEVIPEKYEDIVSLLKKNYRDVTDMEASSIIKNSIEIATNLDMLERREMFADALIEDHLLAPGEKTEFMNFIGEYKM
jgi:hypothetical protein